LKITVLSVQITSAPNKSGKLFQTADVAFKNHSFQDKIEGKKITQYSEAAFKVLADPTAVGKTFEVEIEKKDGFNNWVSMQPAGAGAPAVANVPQGAAAPRSPASTPVRSTYETPEERAQRQVFIVRQSSLSNAVATLAVGSKAVKSNDVISLAKEYEGYVFGSPAPVGGATGFDDVPDLDPLFEGQPNIV
jgi:hypothetical protein